MNGMSKAKKARVAGQNEMISSMVGGEPTKSKAGIIERPKEKPNLPDWANSDYKPPYQMGSGMKDVGTNQQLKKKMKKKKTGVTRPRPWNAKTVLSPKF